jgi:hypothetical protein
MVVSLHIVMGEGPFILVGMMDVSFGESRAVLLEKEVKGPRLASRNLGYPVRLAREID